VANDHQVQSLGGAFGRSPEIVASLRRGILEG